ncbi:deoxyribodipyrimidine photo-lyase [Halapricum sp. CBA1109]|uniref:cryptochrome/photolyase family protein n=1 Tax=Halapricum sp. CBA1109 TaxID=2668068 RepID=UPI0013B77AD8|nr:deoxyribodipyrimidine photo-lyase [Halapricum sp. CBA1109]
MNVYWHQRDLRIPDNRGLYAAGSDGPAVPVYVYDESMLKAIGTRQRAFFLRGVRRLKRRYRERGSDLLVRAGSPEEILPEVVDEFDADALYYDEHYRPKRRNRQRRVEDALDVPTHSRVDLVLVDPDRLESRYPNHSQFHDDWQEIPKPPALGDPDHLAAFEDETTVPVPDPDIDLPEAGYRAARDRWESFLDDGIEHYSSTRDDMTAAVERPTNSVSRLSPYLAAGMIGIREVYGDATDRYEAAGSATREIGKYRYELSWREQSYHLLYHNPRLLTENYKEFPNPIQWREDEAHFEAWKRGETGYPFVDAGMRQLNEEGYMHNRTRQIVASFLSKHLLIDWRKGARYFTKQLVDHDPASNYASWQWTASTGTDSVDVRIFDPVSQMSKYDDDATYVKAYVPELRDVPASKIVDWPTLSREGREKLAPEYYHPIVDRNDAYERAQAAFETALGKR